MIVWPSEEGRPEASALGLGSGGLVGFLERLGWSALSSVVGLLAVATGARLSVAALVARYGRAVYLFAGLAVVAWLWWRYGERVSNLLRGRGWKTDRDVALDALLAREAG